MKIAIYCRVSTDEQNIKQQKDLIVDWCNKNGHTYRSYMDENQSGKVKDRPQWSQLVKDVDKGDFEGIAVSKWDRMTRDSQYACILLDWLKPMYERGFRLYSIYDGELEFTPDKIFQFKLKCLLAEYELSQNAWRRQIGIERAKREGKYKYGRGRPKPKEEGTSLDNISKP